MFFWLLFRRKKRKGFKPNPKDKNFAGERLDRLTADGELPFGWVVHNKKFIDEQEQKIYRQMSRIGDAKGNVEKLAAFRDYFDTVDEVGKFCKKKGPCQYKWFTYYIIESQWYNDTVKDYRQLQIKQAKAVK